MTIRAVFLDRDGVINIDNGYVINIKDFVWVDHSREAIKLLNDNGFLIVVVTNQSGICRGYFTEKQLIDLHTYINEELGKIGAKIDDFFYSPYHPEGKLRKQYEHLSNLRKPKTGMLKLATDKWNIDISNSILIGDSQSDIECAESFGIKGYLFKGGNLLNFVNSIIKK